MAIVAVVLFLCCAIAIYIWAHSKKLKKYPPGPFPLPIIGSLHRLSSEPYVDFINLKEIYGTIFSINLGPQRTVILNDYKDIKEALAQPGFNARPVFPHLYDPHDKLPKGIIFAEGKSWEEQKRFTIKNLRDLGCSQESMAHEEIKELLECLGKEVGKPICTTKKHFNSLAFNAVWRMVAGERLSDTQENGTDILHHLAEITKHDRTFGTLGFFKDYTKLLPELTGYADFMSSFLPIYDSMGETIKSHKKTFQPGQSRDLVDRFLEQINNTNDPNSSFYKENGEKHLQMVLYDILFGGMDTIGVTISWTLLLMAHNPDIQEKLIAEIKSAIGDSRLPFLSDRKSTPYVEAVILEVFRVSSLVPIILRRAITDTEFEGFLIPKGTAVYCNIYGVHQSKEIWGDPENFRPERFISKDGITLTNTQYVLLFGFGKRVCPGESLARNQLYLFIASLFQNFRVSLDPDEVSPKIEFYTGTLFRFPKPHRLVFMEQ